MESSLKINALAVQDGALLPGVGLQEPLEKEVIAVAILHLRQTKEMAMEMIQGRAVALQTRNTALEMTQEDRVDPCPKISRIGGIQHGEALVAVSLIIDERTAVSAT